MWETDHQAEMHSKVGPSLCDELKSLQHSQGSASSSVLLEQLTARLHLSTAVSSCAPCRSQCSAFIEGQAPFMDSCPLLSIPSFCLWALENLFSPLPLKLPSSGYSATQLLVIFTHQPYSDQKQLLPHFFLPFQIGKPFNKFIFQVCFLLSPASAFPFSDLFLDTQWSACPNTF